MMTLSELWAHFKLLSSPQSLSQEERTFLERFLQEEYQLREKKRIEYLMKTSGIKRIKFLHEFDWSFNPKIPREKIMEFINTDWLRKPSNLLLIGPAGVGKTHIATAILCGAPHKIAYVELPVMWSKILLCVSHSHLN